MEENEKQKLVALKFGVAFESIQDEIRNERIRIKHEHNLTGTYHSSAHLVDIMNLELDGIRKILISMLSILKEVYYFMDSPYSLEDKSFLNNNIEELYWGRIEVSRKFLLEDIKQLRGNSNLIAIFNGKADGILAETKRDIEIEILSKSIMSLELPDIATSELIKKGEGDTIEFKSSFQWDIENKCKYVYLRKEVITTIAAFSNTKGGYLLIGVDNRGGILGLENDYSLISNRNKDGFLQLLAQELENRTNSEFAQSQNIFFEEYDGREICKIKVNNGKDPIWARYDKNDEFYIRVHESTKQLLSNKEIALYVRNHWPIKR